MGRGKRIIQTKITEVMRDDAGDAVVEAAILFPIIIMIFAALVLLAIYLPTRAALQRATQYAATALSTEKSDSWLSFDEDEMSYVWETNKGRLPNVYEELFMGIGNAAPRGETIVANIEDSGISAKSGELTVDCYVVDWLVYKEIVVTATREFTIPGGLAFIGFPETVPITASSTAVVQNGEEFIRNMDLAVDFINFISEKFGLSNISDSIGSAWGSVGDLLGWKK